MGIDNIMNNQGIEITIVGMVVVFCGLVFIALFLTVLPKILSLFEGKGEYVPEKFTSLQTAKNEVDPKIYAAIAYALHLNSVATSVYDRQIITIRRETPQGSLWSARGKLRNVVSRRNNA